MKTIRVKVPFGQGYVEAFAENLSYGGWAEFIPDPRKAKYHKPKYTHLGGSACYGDPLSIMEGEPPYWDNRGIYAVAATAMKEVIRRWNQRYREHGELGNSQMPLDPDHEALFWAIKRMVDKSFGDWGKQ